MPVWEGREVGGREGRERGKGGREGRERGKGEREGRERGKGGREEREGERGKAKSMNYFFTSSTTPTFAHEFAKTVPQCN